FFLCLSNLMYHLNPADIMLEVTRYGATIGSIGGFAIGIVLIWTKTVIKPSDIALLMFLWGVSFFCGLRIGWQIFAFDTSSHIFSRGMVVGMTIGGTIGGYFTALLLQHYKLLNDWLNILLVTLGWLIALFFGSSFIFCFNFVGVPIGFIFAVIISGFIIGTVGSSIMFWQMK
ncbi:MAG: hypothetical protein AAFY76_24575, partial [Cyanobacteria bacterium J06649_11]